MARPKSDIEPRIVHAAREQFLLHGVDGSSLRAIARSARTSLGMIHYYFATKDDLFFAVIEEQYVKVLSDLERALAADSPVETRMQRLFHRLGTLSDDEIAMVRLVAREALISSVRLERLFERFQRGHIPLFLNLVRDGMVEGTFDRSKSPVTMLLAFVTLAAPAQFVRRFAGTRLPFGAAASGTKLADELVEIVLHGIAARSGDGQS